MTSPSSPASVGTSPLGNGPGEPFGPDAGGEPEASPVAAPSGSGEAATASDYVPADYIPVRAVEDMLRIRHEQIHRYGHTLAADKQRPVRDFAQDIESAARAILEDAQFHKQADRIRRRAIKLGALCMALADRLEGEE